MTILTPAIKAAIAERDDLLERLKQTRIAMEQSIAGYKQADAKARADDEARMRTKGRQDANENNTTA